MVDFIGQFFGQINVGGILDNIIKIFFICGGIILIVVIFFFLYLKKENKKKLLNKKQIGWWEEINGRLEPSSMDDAEEIIIPGTNLVVFYVKKKNLWLPRFTRGITKNLFYVTRTRNGELVNFTIRGLEKDLNEAGLEYDHFDMKFAAENTREFVKRNYKDKATPWWKEYKEIISTAILLIIMTFCFVIIIFFFRDLVKDMATITNSMNQVAEKMNSCSSIGSVIIQK
jgi:hypothetical protein